MKRGQIYFIKSTYHEEGSEQRGDRPAVIVSNNKNNEHSETVEVVYMTTKPKTDLPTHVFIRSALAPSTVLCEQIFTVSKTRIGTLIGELTESEMQAVDRALIISLAIDFGEKQDEKRDSEIKKSDESPAAVTLEYALTELLEAQTERDIYRNLYRELLDNMKGTTNQ